MSDLKKCWNCSEVYDTDDFEQCPECFEYWEDDPEICSDDYEEDYEEYYEEDYELNNSTMNLQTLVEAKREYKGLKSISAYMQENFKEFESQFTVELMNEAVSDYRNKGNKEFVVVYNNRLFSISRYHDCSVAGRNFTGKDPIFSDYYIFCRLSNCIDDSSVTSPYVKVQVKIDDVYFVEDNTEVYKLRIQAAEQSKQRLIEKQAKEIASREADIVESKQYLEDIKKYGTEDRGKIRQLKAVEVIRNSKSTNEEVLEALKDIC